MKSKTDREINVQAQYEAHKYQNWLHRASVRDNCIFFHRWPNAIGIQHSFHLNIFLNARMVLQEREVWMEPIKEEFIAIVEKDQYLKEWPNYDRIAFHRPRATVTLRHPFGLVQCIEYAQTVQFKDLNKDASYWDVRRVSAKMQEWEGRTIR